MYVSLPLTKVPSLDMGTQEVMVLPVYKSPVAAITHYHRAAGLKQQKRILLLFLFWGGGSPSSVSLG